MGYTQSFLAASAYVANLGYRLQGGFPVKARFIEQFVKPTKAEDASYPLNILLGKPQTFPLGSDTMVSAIPLAQKLSAPSPTLLIWYDRVYVSF